MPQLRVYRSLLYNKAPAKGASLKKEYIFLYSKNGHLVCFLPGKHVFAY